MHNVVISITACTPTGSWKSDCHIMTDSLTIVMFQLPVLKVVSGGVFTVVASGVGSTSA